MIEVKYSCDACGLNKIAVHVVERSPKEDVIEFVERAALQCKADHEARSPDCEPRAFSELWIPTQDDVPVGQQPRRQ